MANPARSNYRGRHYFGLLRLGLCAFSALHRACYRLSGGRLGRRITRTAPTLFLTTIGRKTGRSRTVPLIYLADGERWIVIGSMGGSATHPAWWLNLRDHPEAWVEVAGGRWPVRAEEVRGAERDQLWSRLVAIFPSFANYQRATDRPIPVVILHRQSKPTSAQHARSQPNGL
jgi:deazaflavin-dependent oxidoreductase (nitroreductase family)